MTLTLQAYRDSFPFRERFHCAASGSFEDEGVEILDGSLPLDLEEDTCHRHRRMAYVVENAVAAVVVALMRQQQRKTWKPAPC